MSRRKTNRLFDNSATTSSDACKSKRFAVLALVGVLAGCAVPSSDDEFDEAEDVAETSSALTVHTWTDNVKVPGQWSLYAPALVSFGGKLHMVHNGSSNSSELWRSTFNGTSWTPDARISGHRATGSPALAVYQGMMHMAYRKSGTTDLYLAVSYNGGSSWSGAKKSVPTRSAPSLAVFDNKLYMSYCAPTSQYEGNNWLRVEVWNGARWQREENIRIGGTSLACKGSAIASVGNQLRVVYNMVDSDRLWGDTYYMGEAVWSPGEAAVGKELRWKASKNPPAMTVCNGYAHLMHSGESSNKLYWSYQHDWWPSGWSDDVSVPDQLSRTGAGLGCYKGRAIMVHNGNSSNQLWWSSFDQAPVFKSVVASAGTAK